MRRLRVPAMAPWLKPFATDIENLFAQAPTAPVGLPPYPKTALPSAADYPDCQIIVTDEVSGRVPAYSDGTNWRRASDNAIVS